MNEDWSALMDSEVMRNYLSNELAKSASEPKTPEVNEEEVVEAFMELEAKIATDTRMRTAFLQLQNKLGSDKEYAKACDPLFVQAVMMLDLEGAK